MAMNNLTNFLKGTKNFDMVFSNLIKYGLEHGNVNSKNVILTFSLKSDTGACLTSLH
jgi:hypothetical protein